MEQGVLQADYEILEEVAKRFVKLQDRICPLVSSTTNQVETLCSEGWLGEGSQAFQTELREQVLPALGRLCEALGLASTTTKQISDTLRQTEEHVCSMFRT